jgi:hypothetical protein
MASANIVFSCDLLNSLSCLPTVFRDSFFAAGGSHRWLRDRRPLRLHALP